PIVVGNSPTPSPAVTDTPVPPTATDTPTITPSPTYGATPTPPPTQPPGNCQITTISTGANIRRGPNNDDLIVEISDNTQNQTFDAEAQAIGPVRNFIGQDESGNNVY